MHYRPFLRELHERLRPERYLEIGVRWGDSLSLSRCPSIGIDPDFNIARELHTRVDLFKTTSDEYFSRPEPMAPFGGRALDLAFIDGMHLLEYALRDFMHVERHCTPGSVVVFDDVLPRTVKEASRRPTAVSWTGDVYPIVAVLQQHRPDVLALQVDTQPTGLLLLLGLDPGSSVLAERYDEILAEHRRPDPQPVPTALLERRHVLPPARVLESGLLELLAERRGSEPDELRRDLRELAVRRLGPAVLAPGRLATPSVG